MRMVEIDAARAAELARAGATVVDVREANEHAVERIPGARLAPLSIMEAFAGAFAGHTVVVHCRSGNRTTVHAPRIEAALHGAEAAYVLGGGILEWKAAGLPTKTGPV